ncbi:hypothetical protein [Peptostreptococcus anaerobius]
MKHLVIEYFDYYPMYKFVFDNEEDARKFEKEQNKMAEYKPRTEFIYRGVIGNEQYSLADNSIRKNK